MTAGRLWLASALCAAGACAAALPPGAARLRTGAAFDLAGHFSIPPLTRIPEALGPLFGGLSGLAPGERPGEFFAISDERVGSRAYVLRLSGEAAAFRVQVLNTVPLQGSAVPRLDPEGIAVTPGGRLLVSSEGIGNEEPRIPPVIVEYTTSGAFVRELAVRERFAPNPTGPLARGVRPNYGFEALTIAPGGGRLFTATETAIVQDGETATFDRGTLARLLEYRARGETFEPAREFAYPIDPIEPVEFQAGISVAGLVELLALGDSELVALERIYVEEAGGTGRGVNRARLYRVSIDGATDVSAMDSLKDRPGLVPVRKTPLLDLSAVKGLPPELAGLDNFEGLAFGPPLADGAPTLVLVSDDNFNPRQRSWFLRVGLR
jgi:hypothetical protein